MRVEVLAPSGTALFDSDWKSGNVLDWLVADSFGHPLPYGSYRLIVMSKDLAGQLGQKEATLRVGPGTLAVDGQPTGSPEIVLTAPSSGLSPSSRRRSRL